MITWHGGWFGTRGVNIQRGVNLAGSWSYLAVVLNGSRRRLYLCLSVRGMTAEVSRLPDHEVSWLFNRSFRRSA